MSDDPSLNQPAPDTPPPPEPPPQESPAGRVPLDALPEEYREAGALAPHIKDGQIDLAGLAKSYVHAQTLIGGERVPVPKADAPKEEWDAFFERIGRPQAPEGYQLTPPEEAADLVEPELEGWFRNTAHELGLSKTQAAELYNRYLKLAAEATQQQGVQMEAAREEAEQALRGEFGAAFEQRIELARQAATQFGGEELLEALEETGAGNHPAVIKALAAIGQAMSEDTLGPAIRGRPVNAMYTPAEAQSRLAELRADPAYTDPRDPRHANIIAEVERLVEMAYIEGA